MKSSDPTDATPRKPIWSWLGQILLILAIFALIHTWRAQPLASGDAPPLEGRLIPAGEAFDLGQLRGQTALVHFWATWCPMCALGDAAIESIADDFPVISVALQSGDTADIIAHMRQESLTFPVLSDPYGELASRWGVNGVPASFVLDEDSKIRFATVGYTTEIGLRGRLWAADGLD